jgi:hypothetical protein
MHTITPMLAAELSRQRAEAARRRRHDPSSPDTPKRRS